MKNSKKITFGEDGSMGWSSKDKFYQFMVGDWMLNIDGIKIVCSVPSGLVPNYDSAREALNDLARKLKELLEENSTDDK